jgi:peptide/nickel transport system permease protein
VSPPPIALYEQYRVNEATGAYGWVVRAPIPYSPRDYLRDTGDTGLTAPLADPGRVHWFGTDENGADVLSRMIHASRIALGIGFVATGIAMLIGVVIGGLMGYFSGVVDMIGMRLVEIFEAIPTLFLLLTFVAFFGRSLYLMMVIIGITAWPGFARYVRAEFLRLRQQDFVQAAIACGLPLRSVLFRHMLPNGVAPVLVAASFGVASAILAEAVLSFLGLGLVDEPSWGQMLNQAVQAAVFNWWMAVFPGGAIFLTVFAYNLVGESLRDAIDPYLKKTAT